MEIKLPPLRDRGKDIEEIAYKKLHELAQRYGMETKAISPEFFKLLQAHSWPGNVRELINVLEYVLALSGPDPTLVPKHLPPEYRMSALTFDDAPLERCRSKRVSELDREDEFPSLSAYRNKLEKAYLKELINRSGGDRNKACRISGVSQSRLYGLLKKHNLSGFSKA
jgi:transcriptional regulator with PAS, ATPase and Fis domain